MRPIKKLQLVITDIKTKSQHLTCWQQEINASTSMRSLVEQSQQADAKGTSLWENSLTSKESLKKQLYHEQKGLCCYCGQKLPDDFVVEHLNPKGLFPALTFDYNNLYGSCKGGNPRVILVYPKEKFTVEKLSKEYNVKIDAISIPRIPKIEPTKEIDAYTKATITLFTKDKLHCDALKDEETIDVQPIMENNTIYNPHTKRLHNVLSCENRISFSSKGNIQIDGEIEHPTINTLNLNLETLKSKRVEIYGRVNIRVKGLKEEYKKNEVIIELHNQISQIENEPIQHDFAFVEVYFLQEKIEELS